MSYNRELSEGVILLKSMVCVFVSCAEFLSSACSVFEQLFEQLSLIIPDAEKHNYSHGTSPAALSQRGSASAA